MFYLGDDRSWGSHSICRQRREHKMKIILPIIWVLVALLIAASLWWRGGVRRHSLI